MKRLVFAAAALLFAAGPTFAGRSHDRLVADIVMTDRVDVSAAMVTLGWAWVEPRYNVDAAAPARQAAAQQQHIGLWADPSAIAPWDWRRAKRQR